MSIINKEVRRVEIDVHHITRVEGHGNISLKINDGKIEQLLWEVPESPRFFEAMIRGVSWQHVSHIVSRICGICSISHSMASIMATEAAFNIQPSKQTQLLRKLLYNAELLESHVLHSMVLVAPDMLGTDSIFPLAETHTDVVLIALRMKKLAYNLAELLAGRKTHPISLVVGGFTRLPDVGELEKMRVRLEHAFVDINTVVEIIKSWKLPNFNRETEYIALKDPVEYAFISGQIASSDTGVTHVENYLDITNEYCLPHSTAKHARNHRDSYMVGALSRFNLNHKQLHPRARKTAEELGLVAPCYNPFMITIAQVVEIVHALEDSLDIIDQLLKRGIEPELVEEGKIPVKAGRGVGAVEAPRGILFHDYTYDAEGKIKKANCVIPTNQNHANIQKDMEVLVPLIMDRREDEIRHILEILVRAYDPCISCSTH